MPPIFFSGRLPHPIHVSVMGGVRFNNPNGIKNPYIIVILLVTVAVFFPVLTIGVKPPSHVILLASDRLILGLGQISQYITPLPCIIYILHIPLHILHIPLYVLDLIHACGPIEPQPLHLFPDRLVCHLSLILAVLDILPQACYYSPLFLLFDLFLLLSTLPLVHLLAVI